VYRVTPSRPNVSLGVGGAVEEAMFNRSYATMDPLSLLAMKRIQLSLALLSAVLLLGEAPAAPMRHLEYAFAMYPTATGTKGYFNGTLSVDALGAAPDGGALVRMRESWYRAVRPRQPRTCELYAEGTVRCNDGPPFPSESELALFPLLGRDFFKGASLQGESKWQQKFTLSFRNGTYPAAAAMNLKAAPKAGGRVVTGTMSGAYNQLDTTGVKVIVNVTFIYDIIAQVPLVVHDVRIAVPGGIDESTSSDFQLTKDSAANAAESAELQQLGPVRFQISEFTDEGDI
jgi:hypothetical protein